MRDIFIDFEKLKAKDEYNIKNLYFDFEKIEIQEDKIIFDLGIVGIIIVENLEYPLSLIEQDRKQIDKKKFETFLQWQYYFFEDELIKSVEDWAKKA